MLRAVLTVVLVAAAPLPHGLCFCQFFALEAGHEDRLAHSHEGDPHPGDDPHHECDCTLREVPAIGPTPMQADAGSESAVDALGDVADESVARSPLGYPHRVHAFRPFDAPIPLALRALLI